MLSDACVAVDLWARLLFSADMKKQKAQQVDVLLQPGCILHLHQFISFHSFPLACAQLTLLKEPRTCFSSVMFLVIHCWLPLSWSSPLISRNFTSSLPLFRFPCSRMNWGTGETMLVSNRRFQPDSKTKAWLGEEGHTSYRLVIKHGRGAGLFSHFLCRVSILVVWLIVISLFKRENGNSISAGWYLLNIWSIIIITTFPLNYSIRNREQLFCLPQTMHGYYFHMPNYLELTWNLFLYNYSSCFEQIHILQSA